MLFVISIKICFYLLLWPVENIIHLEFQLNFPLKRGKLILKPFFPSIYVLHSSPIFYINHTELAFQDLLYIEPRRSKKIAINFYTFVTGCNTVPVACYDLDVQYTKRLCTKMYCSTQPSFVVLCTSPNLLAPVTTVCCRKTAL